MTAEEYENLPQEIKNIVDSWDDNKDLYAECNRIQKELEQKGWTCDYGLDGMVYDVKQVKNFKQFVNESANNNLYYHGSCKDFVSFENTDININNIGVNGELKIKGNFITKNRKFTKLFSQQHKGKCFIYTVELLTNNIFDLRIAKNLNAFKSHIGKAKYDEFKEEEYIVNGLPVWDLYPVIELAYEIGFDGVKLLEFSTEISNDAIESILVFNPKHLKIVKKEKV